MPQQQNKSFPFSTVILLFASVFFVLLLHSCHITQSIPIETLSPAEKKIDSNFYYIQLVNSALPVQPSSTLKYSIGGVPYADSICLDTLLSEAFLDGVASVINETGLFIASPHYPILKRAQLSPLYDTLSNPESTLVLSLSSIAIRHRFAIYENPGNYEVENTIITTSKVHAFDATSGVLQDVSTHSDTTFLQYIDPNFHGAIKIAANATSTDLVNTAFLSGRSFARRLFPHWMEERRILLFDYDPEMRYAEQLANNDKWEEAMSIWQRLSHHTSTKINYKALYNMAVFYEIEGDLFTSKKQLEKALLCYKKDKRVENYLDIINDRISELERIEKQLNINLL